MTPEDRDQELELARVDAFVKGYGQALEDFRAHVRAPYRSDNLRRRRWVGLVVRILTRGE